MRSAPDLLAAGAWADPVREAPAFREVTGAALIVGRLITLRGLGEDLLESWDHYRTALAPYGALDREIALIPAHDLSRFEEYVGFEGCFRIAIGATIAIAHADDGPSAERAFGLDAVSMAFERVAEIDFARIDRRCRSTRCRSTPSDAAVALRHQTSQAMLVPFGPIASATLAWGSLAPGDALPERERRRIRGSDMRDRAHRRAVHGEIVARAVVWDIALPRLERRSDPARPDDAYHLIASYG